MGSLMNRGEKGAQTILVGVLELREKGNDGWGRHSSYDVMEAFHVNYVEFTFHHSFEDSTIHS